MRGGRFLAVAALAGVGLLVGSGTPARAATSILYAAPTQAGTGDCSTTADACSITTAVTTANGESVTDSVRIRLVKGSYPLPSPSPTALPITFAGPSLTIEAVSGTPTLNGKKTVRLLSVAAGSNVTIDGLEIEFGLGSGLGGAIQNNGTLSVKNSTFSSNAAGNGGAITNSAGATLAVEDSTFSHNTATSVGGGAIIAFGAATITRSALINNEAPINGGAINVQPGGSATVSNSTIAGNASEGLGGGVSTLGTLTVQASTITDNTGSDGGAIAAGNTDVTLAADIIAAQSPGGTCSPAGALITDAGYNLDDDGTCISPASPAAGSHAGTAAYGSSTYGAVLDAYLADGLAENGGSTKTFALLNSPSPATTLANPAFDVVPANFNLPAAVGGVSAACSLPDQRGVVPAAGARCAIGAYLLQATKTSLGASAATAAPNAAVTYTATVGPAPDGGTVAFDDGAGNPATTQCAAQPVAGGTATCTVSYANPGGYTATATYSGDGAMNNFAGSGSATQSVAVAPVAAPPTAPTPAATLTLSDVAVTRCMGTAKGAHKNVTVRYRVGAPSRVTFTLQRRIRLPSGTKTKCPPVLQRGDYVNAHATRVLKKTVSVAAGAHTFRLKSLLGTTTLKPGRYRVVVQARSATGATARSVAYFWVLKPKRKAAAR